MRISDWSSDVCSSDLFLNLPRFERLSHAAEDVLSEIRAGKRIADPATVSAVLGIMDRNAELAEAVAIGAALPQENDDYLIAALTGRLVAAEVAGPDENESLTAAVAVARASGDRKSTRLNSSH